MEPIGNEPEVVHQDSVPSEDSGGSSATGWRWLWLLVPIALFAGLILWILW